jgi:CarD family transcriptional regulator
MSATKKTAKKPSRARRPRKKRFVPKFAKGDKVVYGMHGVGVVDGIETIPIEGKSQRFYVIDLSISEMTVKIPVEKAQELGMRGVIDKREIPKVIRILRSRPTAMNQDWKKRYQDNLERIKSGSIFEVTEVARNLYKRNQRKELSVLERKLYENAYQLIVGEIALTKGIEVSEAEDYISDALD